MNIAQPDYTSATKKRLIFLKHLSIWPNQGNTQHSCDIENENHLSSITYLLLGKYTIWNNIFNGLCIKAARLSYVELCFKLCPWICLHERNRKKMALLLVSKKRNRTAYSFSNCSIRQFQDLYAFTCESKRKSKGCMQHSSPICFVLTDTDRVLK